MKFRMWGLVMASLFLLGATLGSSSNSDPAQQRIDGVWTGERTNGIFGTFMTMKLTTNGYGAFEYGGGPSDFGLPGTFTYTLADGQIRYLTNGTSFLVGALRYDAAADIIVYQSTEPIILLYRDTNALRDAMLGSMIGATNSNDLNMRVGHFIDSITNHPEWFPSNSAQKSAQQDSAANGSQLIRSVTNGTPSAAGSRR